MVPRWSVIGAPSSAGARTPGVERAPEALRAAGLLSAFDDRGRHVNDFGDVPGFRWRPDLSRPAAQNAGPVVQVATDLAKEIAAAPGVPLVLGGDATVMLGLVAATGSPALVHVAGSPGLGTPDTSPHGSLGAMVLSHLLGLPGCDPMVAAVASVPPERLVAYGFDRPYGDPERDLVDRLRLTYVPGNEVRTGPAKAAARARFAAEAMAQSFVVHLDVAVLAFAQAPFADLPEAQGLTLQELVETLSVLVASPQFAGMAVTGVNPDHVPPEIGLTPLVDALAAALA
ncbi:arginase family protein [Couchioplanes caeruleus]|uniref:Arginase n=2 Tax=Couchioplanes caeruleus TaxID=56438 RepID=A0A1K0FNI1_9ACTN|nr:arginase family protein [Couchioplanes caeruleus]OJF14345.1 arginase [Couchioplanes caeruleus subsp. caeruleus]ROP32871.1 arginase [Couchioplanes caeruleus]